MESKYMQHTKTELLRKTFPFSETLPLIGLLPENGRYLELNHSDCFYRRMIESHRKGESEWVEYCFEHLLYHITHPDPQKTNEQTIELIKVLQNIGVWILEDSSYLLIYPEKQLSNKRAFYKHQLQEMDFYNTILEFIQKDELAVYPNKICHKVETSHYLNNPKEILGMFRSFAAINRSLFNEKMNQFLPVYKYISTLPRTEECEIKIESFYSIICDNEKDILRTTEQKDQRHLLTSNIALCGAQILACQDQKNEAAYRLLMAKYLRYLASLSKNFGELLTCFAVNALNGAFTLTNELDWTMVLTYSPELVAESLGKKLQNHPQNLPLAMSGYLFGTCALNLVNKQFNFLCKEDSPGVMQVPQTRVELIKDKFYLELVSKYDYSKPEEFSRMIQDIRRIAQNTMLNEVASEEEETDSVVNKGGKPHAQIADNVYVRITKVNSGGLHVEVDDAEYCTEPGKIPFVNITPAYTTISDFSSLFNVGDYLYGTVESVDPLILTIRQDLNYCLMEDVEKESRLTGIVTGVKDNCIGWLLETGASCLTPKLKGFTPKKGEYYNLIYKGIDSNGNITGQPCKPFAQVGAVDCESEFKEVLRSNMIDFANERFKSSTGSQESGDTLEAGASDIANADLEAKEISISKELFDELILILELRAYLNEDIKTRYRLYEILSILASFTELRNRASYYKICADYLNCILLISNEESLGFGKPEIQKRLDDIQDLIEQHGVLGGYLALDRIDSIVKLLSCLHSPVDFIELQHFRNSEDETIRELSRIFMILTLLGGNEEEEKSLFLSKAKMLLGCPITSRERCNSIYFGREDTKTEFKTSAYESAESATEEQPLILAKTLAAFMNTDGGTLYIGVNDEGYCVGMNSDLRYTHNSVDKLLRHVPKRIFSYLGSDSDWNKYMEYIKFSFMKMPANDNRLVMAFRVPAMKEPVYVKGNIYTRSGSRTVLKREENLKEFLKSRPAVDGPVVKEPEYPNYLNDENIWTFPPLQSIEPTKPAEVLQENSAVTVESVETRSEITDSIPETLLRINTSKILDYPMTRLKSEGFTDSHYFLYVSETGQIAACPNTKTGKWAQGENCRMLCSFNSAKKECHLLCVYSDCTITIGTLKSYNNKKNINKFSKLYDTASKELLFIAPVRKEYYLFLVFEDSDGTRFFRTISLDKMRCGISAAGYENQVLPPNQYKIVYTEVIPSEIVSKYKDKLSRLADDNYDVRQWNPSTETECPDVMLLREICFGES